MILMTGSHNVPADSKSMEYWNEVRVRKMSTNSAWLDEVYEDASTLISLAQTKGTSDKLRLSYTSRAIEALEEIEQFLKSKGE